MSNNITVTGHNLDTSEGARAYVAEFFATQVRRHDFRAYITTRLAADFACALAQHLAARQPAEFERAIPTHRRESAVELLLSMGFVWNNQHWEDRRHPLGQEPAYNAAGISLTACQLHEALLMAGDPELDVPFEDRSLVRIFSTETGHSGPGLYCECVDAEEGGCILLDGSAPAIRQTAQAVDLAQFRPFIAEARNNTYAFIETMRKAGRDSSDARKKAELTERLLDLIDSQAPGREPNSEPNRLTERAESVPVMLKGIGKINGDGWKDTTTIGEVVFVWPNELQKPYAPGQYDRVGNQCGWTASTSQYDFQPATHAEVREFVEAMAAESWERAAELDRLNPDRAVACGQASIITKDSTNG